MEKCHKLTEEENNELYHISKLLKSEDQESIDLGIGLLKNYPMSARAEYVSRPYRTLKRTSSLSEIILAYESRNLFTLDFMPTSMYVYDIIDFVFRVLIEQCYYEDECTEDDRI